MTTYQQAMDFINAIPYIGQRNGVNRVQPLLRLLGDPQNKLKLVHIAGTNGKGSTAAMTASVLRDAGLKTGLFISPYVEDFRERIQLDGHWISKEDLAAEADLLIPLFRQLQAQGQGVTEFEFDAAMALHYFVEQGCDAAVLEAGMGGRLDATNAVPAPAVCALTSISYDHTKYLGDTLAQIAAAKCGILKPGARAAIYPKQSPEAMETILVACREKGISPNIPDLPQLEILSCNEEGSQIRYKGRPLTIPLLGEHQIYNALTVCAICEELEQAGWPVGWQNVSRGIGRASFGGRQEAVCRRPLCLIDGAHNPDGVDSLCRALDTIYKGRKLTVVMGMLEDKDYRYGLAQLARRADRFIAVTPAYAPRALPAQRAAELAAEFCNLVHAIEDPAHAAAQARAQAGPEDMVLACGSLYMIGDAKRGFLSLEP